MSASAPVCRVIVDGQPHPGAWNMAVDEVLLQAAVDAGMCSLRWYRWDRPTVSLGYFQDASAVRGIPELAGLPVVRRLSGGGAIVHDQELTYACALPASHAQALRPRELYTRIHQRVIEGLAGFGVTATLRGLHDRDRDGVYLCFGRGDAFDVVIGAEKILGSAQRRRKGAILQHGSLVLRRSSYAPQFRGLFDCASVVIDVDRLSQCLTDGVSRSLAGNVELHQLSSDEEEQAEKLASERYREV